jgi:hypothetical protein
LGGIRTVFIAMGSTGIEASCSRSRSAPPPGSPRSSKSPASRWSTPRRTRRSGPRLPRVIQAFGHVTSAQLDRTVRPRGGRGGQTKSRRHCSNSNQARR